MLGYHQTILFLFLSSPNGSSSSLSAVSAGFSNEWTLLAMLLRRVLGAESVILGANLELGFHDQLLSILNVEGVVSLLVKGGVSW